MVDSQQTQNEQSKLCTGRHNYGKINVPTRTALAINAVQENEMKLTVNLYIGFAMQKSTPH